MQTHHQAVGNYCKTCSWEYCQYASTNDILNMQVKIEPPKSNDSQGSLPHTNCVCSSMPQLLPASSSTSLAASTLTLRVMDLNREDLRFEIGPMHTLSDVSAVAVAQLASKTGVVLPVVRAKPVVCSTARTDLGLIHA